MPPAPLLTPDARRNANHLLDVLQRQRVADRAAATKPSVLGPCGVDAKPWARMSRTPVATIAHTLLRGICEGSPQTEVRQRALVRWLGAQLRNSDPGHGQLRTAPARHEPAHESPRSS